MGKSLYRGFTRAENKRADKVIMDTDNRLRRTVVITKRKGKKDVPANEWVNNKKSNFL